MSDSDVETREGESQGRKVVLHFVRHGEAGYSGWDDAEGDLTEKGKVQAALAGEKIFKELPKGVVVEFLSSHRRRAVETIAIIEKKIEELAQVDDKDFLLHKKQKKETLSYQRLGMSDEMTWEALKLRRQKEEEVIYWLQHEGKIPEEIEKNFGSLFKHLSYFTRHLSVGPDVHIILSTHTGSAEVLVGKLLGKTSIDTLANCEEFTITMPTSGRDIEIKYKDLEERVKLNE